MKSFFAYLQASRAELAKVSWPTRKQTLRLTMMVIVFSFIFAFGLGAVDYVFSTTIQKVILKG
jgi:preprotein translocase subunit SecE